MRFSSSKSRFSKPAWVKITAVLFSVVFLLTALNTATLVLANPDDDGKFTIAIIPDTQWETSDSEKIIGQWFKNRTEWLADNKDDLDLRFVLHTGDVVNWPRFDANQLPIASEAMAVLDNAGVRSQLALGNHDTHATKVGGSAVDGESAHDNIRITTLFNAAFPVTRFPGMVTREPNKVENAYQTFEACGLKWLVLALELWPRTAVINWAKTVVSSYPDHNVIIHTHAYLGGGTDIQQDNGGYGDNSPQFLFDNLIKQYPNIKFVFCGHTGSAAQRVDTGVHGNKIVTVRGCFHNSNDTNPVQLMEIDVNNNKAATRFYSPRNNNNMSSYGWTFDDLSFLLPSKTTPKITRAVSITNSARVGIKDGVPVSTTFNAAEDQIGRNANDSSTYAKLYYKTDLSDITEPVISAKLKFYAKCYVGNTLSVYAVEDNWDDTISFNNQPRIGSKVGQTNLQANFNGEYPYVDREIDISKYVRELQENNDNLFNVMLDFVHSSTSNDTRFVVKGTSHDAGPYLEIITGSGAPVFSKIAGVPTDIPLTSVGVVDKNNPDINAYEPRGGTWPDQIGTGTVSGVEQDKRVFYKGGLSSVLDKEIIAAQLVIMERRMQGVVQLRAFKATSDWDMSTISYNNQPTYDPTPIGVAPSSSYEGSATIKEIDITDYIKSLSPGNSTANIMLMASNSTARADMSHIYTIISNYPPTIRVFIGSEVETNSLSNEKIVGTWMAKGGTEQAPLTVTPILVLYKGDVVKKVAIGEQKSIVGSGLVKAEIDLTGITIDSDHILKMFIWGDTQTLNPMLSEPGTLEPIVST